MPQRTIEPYRDPRLPERFLRWIESGIRARFRTIPCYTESDGSPEGVINGTKADRYFDLTGNQIYVKTTATGNTGWVLVDTGGGAPDDLQTTYGASVTGQIVLSQAIGGFIIQDNPIPLTVPATLFAVNDDLGNPLLDVVTSSGNVLAGPRVGTGGVQLYGNATLVAETVTNIGFKAYGTFLGLDNEGNDTDAGLVIWNLNTGVGLVVDDSAGITDAGITQRSNLGAFEEYWLELNRDADVILNHNGVNVARTATLAAGGFEVNNTVTGVGFERVLTASDLVAGNVVDGTIEGQGVRWDVANSQYEPAAQWAVDDGVAGLENSMYLGKRIDGAKYEIVGSISTLADKRGFFGFEQSTLRMYLKNTTSNSDVAISARDGGAVDRLLAIFSPVGDTLIRGQVTGLRLNTLGTGLIRMQPGGVDRATFNSSGQFDLLGNGTQSGILKLTEGIGGFATTAGTGQLYADTADTRLKWRDSADVENTLAYLSDLSASVPTPTAFGLLVNDAATWTESPSITWNESLKELSLDVAAGVGPAVSFDNIDPSGVVIQMGGPGSASTNYVAMRMYDQTAASFFLFRHDYGNSSPNHEFRLESDNFGTIWEIENEGNIYLQGAESTSRFFLSIQDRVQIRNDSTLFLQGVAAAVADLTTYGQIYVSTVDDGLYYKYDGDTAVRLDVHTTAPVASVFGRTGAVTALQADYDAFFLTPAEGNAAYGSIGDVAANTAKVTNATHTGEVTGSGALTIANDAVTNTKLANMAANTVKAATIAGNPVDLLVGTDRIVGHTTASGILTALQGSQVNVMLPVFTSGLKGLAPASGGGAINFLRADGTWAAPTVGAVAFDSLTSKTGGTGNYTTTGDFTADNFEATGLGPLTTPGSEDAYFGGYGVMGDRAGAPVYITNANATGQVGINAGGVHGSANRVALFSPGAQRLDGVLYLEERAAAAADTATLGQFWVDDRVENMAFFTNDVGQDFGLHALTERQVSDQVVNNSTTLVTSTNLVIANLPAGLYRVSAILLFRDVAVSNCDARFRFLTASVSSTNNFARVSNKNFSGTGAPSFDEIGLLTDTFDNMNLTTGSGTSRFRVDGMFQCFSGGSISVQFAQNVATVQNLELEAGSFLVVEHLGTA